MQEQRAPRMNAAYLHIARKMAGVPLEDLVNARLQDDAVIACIQPDLWYLVPARLSSARDAVVHHVVRHEKKSLQPLDAPANAHSEKRLILGNSAVAQSTHACADVAA